jgi:hypothetical protein
MTAKRNGSSTTGNAKKKMAIKDTPHVLLWVPHNGLGLKKTWTDLKALGIFPSKAAAEAERAKVMGKYDNCGHGDILVGGRWDDEVDLVIKPCESFLGTNSESLTTPSSSSSVITLD